MAEPETPKSAATRRAERAAEKKAAAAAKAKREATDKQRKADRARADALKKEQRDVTRERDKAPLLSAAREALNRKKRELGAEARHLRTKKYD
jgi:hypothetical protein